MTDAKTNRQTFTAITIAFAFYSVPLEVTKAPNSLAGFTGIVLALVVLLMLLPTLVIFPHLRQLGQRSLGMWHLVPRS
jgi:hypothetical protein